MLQSINRSKIVLICLGLVMALVSSVIIISKYAGSSKPGVTLRALQSPTDAAGWKTYTNRDFLVTFQYPPQFEVVAHEGSSQFEERFLAVDIGTSDYMKALAATEGAETPPIFLRITASKPKNPVSVTDCGEYTFAENVTVNGVFATKCVGESMGGLPSMTVRFKSTDSDLQYGADTMSNSGANQALIEQIISTIKILQ